MRKYWWLLILPVLLLLWWSSQQIGPVTTVHFSKVQRTTIESTVLTNGKVEPAKWASARAEVAGVVRTVAVTRGQTVHAGETLITLDTTAAQANLAAALARQQEAESENANLERGGKAAAVANLNDSIRSARAAVEVAQRIYNADRRLLEHQAVTKLQVQTDADALSRAKLNLAAFENQKQTLVTQGDRSVGQANLQNAKAAVALARHTASLGVVNAPMAGTIYQFDIKLGAYLEPGALVANVGDLDQVKVVVDVDEPDLGRVALEMPVTIVSDSRPDQTWHGRVDKLPTQVISLGTRTVGEVSTIVDNPNHDLLPGVSVNATIISHVVKDAVAIPKSALRRLDTQNGVFKLANNVITWIPVQTGASDVNNVQILSGLASGDLVADRILSPSDAELKTGMRVKPVY